MREREREEAHKRTQSLVCVCVCVLHLSTSVHASYRIRVCVCKCVCVLVYLKLPTLVLSFLRTSFPTHTRTHSVSCTRDHGVLGGLGRLMYALHSLHGTLPYSVQERRTCASVCLRLFVCVCVCTHHAGSSVCY